MDNSGVALLYAAFFASLSLTFGLSFFARSTVAQRALRWPSLFLLFALPIGVAGFVVCGKLMDESGHCGPIPDFLAMLFLPVAALALLGFMFVMPLLVLIAGVAEVMARRRDP